MKKKILLVACSMVVVVGCVPDKDDYKYKPTPIPQLPEPTDTVERNREELDKALRELEELNQLINRCVEAKPTQIELKGVVPDDQVEISESSPKRILSSSSKPASFERKNGTVKQLVSVGCDEEFIKTHSRDSEYEVVKKQTVNDVIIADKVLLCGTPFRTLKAAHLMVSSETLVLSKFKVKVEGMASISLTTGNLELYGRNSIAGLSKPDSFLAWNLMGFSVNVETAIRGDGHLTLSSEAAPCPQKSTETP